MKKDELSLLIKREEILKGLILNYVEKEKIEPDVVEEIKFEMSNCAIGDFDILVRKFISLEIGDKLIKKSKTLLNKWKAEEVDRRKKENRKEKAEEKKKKFEEAIQNEDVKFLMKDKRHSEASEILVKKILKNNKIFTLRHDEKNEIWIYRPYCKYFCI